MIMSVFRILFVFLLLFSCTSQKEKQVNIDWNKKKSVELNKVIAAEEAIDIKLYLQRHLDWKMIATGSGLQYYIYEHGEGDSLRVGDIVDIKYLVKTFDDTICYQTASDEVLEVKIDHSQVETGLQEGLKKMCVGDKAKMIIPSHLAHGLTGDFNKIPPLTPILVDVQVVELLNRK